MNPDFYARAVALARRAYDIQIEPETLSDGRKVYVAENPEITRTGAGCYGQGETVDEAAKDLEKARIALFWGMLSDGLTPPAPREKQAFFARITL